MERLEFELAFYIVAVLHVNHYAMETPPHQQQIKEKIKVRGEQ